MDIGKRIQSLRKKARMSQEKLSNELDITFQAISKWENGISYPDIEMLPKLAEVFSVSLDYLMTGSSNKNIDSYDEKYKKGDVYLDKPSDMCYEVMKFMPPSRPLKLLEICCGEGDDAVFYARNGYKVTCFDLSDYAVGKVRRKAEQLGLEINVFVADIREFEFSEEYDVIYSNGALHYLPEYQRKDFIDNCKIHTRRGGLNALSVNVKKPFIVNETNDSIGNEWHSGELLRLYHDWLIEDLNETIKSSDNSGTHAVFTSYARKIESYGEEYEKTMKNGNWEKIYLEQGRVQIEVLDTVVEAVDLFKESKCKNVLDLGCGTGRHSLYLADQGFDLHACDISETGLEITKKLLQESNYNDVEYSIQDMYSLTLEDSTFDGVLCVWVQGHGYKSQVQKGVDEIHRILRTGGLLVTDFVTVNDSTYGIGDEIAPNTFLGGRPGEEDIPHYYTNKEELELMFQNYNEVHMKDKTYKFKDNFGNEHIIESIVVTAKK